MQRWVFVLAFALVFYVNGAGFIESFVNYPSWRVIGPDTFRAYHRSITPGVVGLLVAPAVLATLFTIALLRFRPAAVPLWAVWVALALQVVSWISTATIQLPIQFQLAEQGAVPALIDRLIETNLWLRRVPNAICAGLFAWMAARAISPGERNA